jgi:hypothetical protein
VSSVGAFRVTIPEDRGPVTGRAFVLLSRAHEPEPRLQRVGWGSVQPFVSVDVEGLGGGDAAVLDAGATGYPVERLAGVEPGRYAVQALVDVYELYRRRDGHEVWLPHVGWEGRVFTKTPGNLYSEPVVVDVDPSRGTTLELRADRVVAPVTFPPDSQHVRRFRIESRALSAFWGRPMHVGATVLLPRGYEEERERRYPVIYVQNHFSLDAPFDFPEDAPSVVAEVNEIQLEAAAYHRALGHVESPEEFRAAWLSDGFPRVLAVTFQHPNPWFDSSHAVNSANAGPFEDALVGELLPEVERRFRTIPEAWARVLTGGSTGGWTSLALQVRHPELFGGAWVLFPDPVDFRRMGLSDIYRDESMFVVQDAEDRDRDHRFPSQQWGPAERPFRRSVEGQVQVTFREMSRLESAIGSRCRSGLQLQPWQAIFGPVGEDGYPRPLWDEHSGAIDREVAHSMRGNGYDLGAYLQEHWREIGPSLVGKLHFFCGEMDNYFLNVPLYLLQDFLERADPPYEGSFTYARPKQGHYTIPSTHSDFVRRASAHMEAAAPREHAALG